MINQAMSQVKKLKSKPYSDSCFSECRCIIEKSLLGKNEVEQQAQIKRLSEVLEYEIVKFAIDMPMFIVATLALVVTVINVLASVLENEAQRVLFVYIAFGIFVVLYSVVCKVAWDNIKTKAKFATLKVVADERLENLKAISCVRVKLAKKRVCIKKGRNKAKTCEITPTSLI